MQELGVTSRTVNIADSVRRHFKDIGHDEKVKNAAYENAQARTRTLVLMDIANDENGLVVGTGDLSELALGWATYNGDHMSMYGVNALIRHEAARLGGEAEKVLTDILNTEISPELLPPENGKIAQKTEELVGPYELHDFYLYYAVRWGFSPKKVYFLAKKAFAGAYGDETLKKWLVSFHAVRRVRGAVAGGSGSIIKPKSFACIHGQNFFNKQRLIFWQVIDFFAKILYNRIDRKLGAFRRFRGVSVS